MHLAIQVRGLRVGPRSPVPVRGGPARPLTPETAEERIESGRLEAAIALLEMPRDPADSRPGGRLDHVSGLRRRPGALVRELGPGVGSPAARFSKRGRYIMTKWIWLVVATVLLGATPPVGAVDLGLITGSEKGTYYQFGLNLQRLVQSHGINLTVHTSKGSIENVEAVYQRPGVQMGIVQSDVLAFVARVQSDPVLKRIARKTRMVFPLYNEEVHLLGRRGIADFDDLSDRRVAMGREGSGTYLTARLLVQVAEDQPRAM